MTDERAIEKLKEMYSDGCYIEESADAVDAEEAIDVAVKAVRENATLKNKIKELEGKIYINSVRIRKYMDHLPEGNKINIRERAGGFQILKSRGNNVTKIEIKEDSAMTIAINRIQENGELKTEYVEIKENEKAIENIINHFVKEESYVTLNLKKENGKITIKSAEIDPVRK